MLFTAQRDVSLHGGTESIHVAIGVFEGQNVVAFRERIEVRVILQILLGHVAIEGFAAALIGEKEIFRQSVGFVPGVGRVFVGAGTLFLTRQRFFGEISGDGVRELLVNIHRDRIV